MKNSFEKPVMITGCAGFIGSPSSIASIASLLLSITLLIINN